MIRGRFVTVEGGEGAGKSTQVRLLAQALTQRGLAVVATREPGGAPGAEAIRGLLVEGDRDRWDALTEALLHFAARRDHMLRTIEPALAGGAWVVSDRFADSTVVYQGYGQGLSRATIAELHRLVLGDVRPDLTLVLDVPVELGLERARKRGAGDRYERMDRSFHERLREGFLAIARAEPARCVVVDATGSAEATHRRMLRIVNQRLGDGGAGR